MPAPSRIPTLEKSSLAALYRAARVGGDFFDFEIYNGKLIFLLLDIAGRRQEALAIAAAVQDEFHSGARRIFGDDRVNDASDCSELAVLLNHKVIDAAKGVRCAPAFLGSYDEELGILFYVNAGHIPGLLRDSHGMQRLEANGLPLGLFSHATHDAQTVVLEPGAALLMVSKGLVESRKGRQEFGLERLEQSMASLPFHSASELCSKVLTAVEEFTKNTPGQNDITTLALMRSVAVESAAAAAL